MATERDSWCISLGRWGRVEFRLHAAFPVAVLLLMITLWQEARPADSPPWSSLGIFVLLWFFSVLAHELGHLLVTYPIADELESVTLLPWGGFRRLRSTSQAHLVPIVTGPMVSLAMALFCYALLQARQSESLAHLIQPASLTGFLTGNADDPYRLIGGLRMMVCVNAWIVLLNLIPAFPFDGAWACVTILCRWRRDWARRRSTIWMIICSRGLALLALIGALVIPPQIEPAIVPDWWLLLVLALTIYFAARSEEDLLADDAEDKDELGYDFSQGYTSLEQTAVPRVPPPTAWQRCWIRLRRRWQARRARIEAEEDARVDSILGRLHLNGMSGLTPEERALLRRASTRYRNRQSS